LEAEKAIEKPPPKFTVIFFSYIAIRQLFVFFDDNSLKMRIVTAIVIHIALALKYFLFLYLFWAFETGRLLFYLVRVRQVNKEVEDEWQKFRIVFEKNASEGSIVSRNLLKSDISEKFNPVSLKSF